MKYKKTITDLALIIIGTFLYAFGIALFLDPNQLTPAGVSGLALVINHLFEQALGSSPVTAGTIIIVLNIPIMLLGI